MAHNSPVPGSNGDHYIPFDQRTGDKSVVYFTRDLSAQGLVSIFRRVSGVLTGKVAVKVHTGEQHGPNIIPRSWVKALMEQELPGGTIVETNTYYDGDRYTTEKHRKTLQVNGWTFSFWMRRAPPCSPFRGASGLTRCPWAATWPTTTLFWP